MSNTPKTSFPRHRLDHDSRPGSVRPGAVDTKLTRHLRPAPPPPGRSGPQRGSVPKNMPSVPDRARHHMLVSGDLLFRFIIPSQSRGVQKVIKKGQWMQDSWDQLELIRNGYTEKEAFRLDANQKKIGHAGIYIAGNRSVYEVGGTGIKINPIAERQHYDLVVRFPAYWAQNIASVTPKVRYIGSGKLQSVKKHLPEKAKRTFIYPILTDFPKTDLQHTVRREFQPSSTS